MRTKALMMAAAFGVSAAAFGEAPRLSEVDELSPLVARWAGMAEEIGLPGYAIAVLKDGELYAAEGFGVRDVVYDEPATPETMYYIASVTKTYLAGAVIKLADEGLIDLDAPVKRYVSEFELKDSESSSSITVRELIGHAPGLNSSMAVMLDAYTGHITDERYFHWLSEEEPSGEIRYTNVHYTLLGRLVERVTGLSWRDHLDEAIFTPAGMDRTTGYASELYLDRDSAFPLVPGDGGPERAEVVKNDAVMHAAGGLGTSALDGARWIELHLNGGKADGRRVFSEAAMEEMLAFQSEFGETRGRIRAMQGFAGGWQRGVWRLGESRYYQHGGGYIGTAAHFSFLRDDGLGIVILANMSPEGQAFCDVVSIDYYDAMLGVEEKRRDLLPLYVERVKEYRAGQAEDEVYPRLTSRLMTLPAGRYHGVFGNEHVGLVRLEFRGGELCGWMGNVELGLHECTTDEANSLRVDVLGDLLKARFLIEDGTVTALEIALDEDSDAYTRFDLR